MLDPFQLTALGAYGGPVGSYGDIFMSDLNFVLQLAGPVKTDFSTVFPTMVCRVGDQGVRVIVQIVDSSGEPVNLRDATTLKMKFLKPDGSKYDGTPVFLTNGYDGKIVITSTGSIPPFDQSGQWFLQAEAMISSIKQSTEWGAFEVEDNIDNT